MTKNQNSDRLVNKPQLAVLYDKSVVTIDAWCRRGMPYVRKGNKSKDWQFDTAAVAKWREKKSS